MKLIQFSSQQAPNRFILQPGWFMGRTDGLQHTALHLQTLTGNLGGKGIHKTVPFMFGNNRYLAAQKAAKALQENPDPSRAKTPERQRRKRTWVWRGWAAARWAGVEGEREGTEGVPLVCAMAEVQKPQPGQRHLAQSHRCRPSPPCQWLFTSSGRAVGPSWRPQDGQPVGAGSNAHHGASPVPPGSPAWRELCSLGRLQRVSASSFTPKIWARDSTAATAPQPPLSCPSATAATAPGCCSGSVSPQAALAPADRHTDGLHVTLRSQQGLDPGSPFPTLLLKC